MALTGNETEAQLLQIYTANTNFDSPPDQDMCFAFIGAARALVARAASLASAGRSVSFDKNAIQSQLDYAQNFKTKFFTSRAKGRSSFVGSKFSDPAGARA